MFWNYYTLVGLVMGVCFLLFGMLQNLRTPPDLRTVTPFDLMMNLLICILLWPMQLLIWFKIHNDDDGPWSG